MAHNGLLEVVERNEAAKRMRTSGAQVRLRSLDAVIRSSRIHSQRLAGFREVSQQMRQWSDELELELEKLVVQCASEVRIESNRRNRLRRERLLHRALGGRPRSDGKRDREAPNAAYRRSVRETVIQLERIGQLGLMAVVLSRTALFEAVNAHGEERAILVHAANEFRVHAESVSHLATSLLPGARRALEVL